MELAEFCTRVVLTKMFADRYKVFFSLNKQIARAAMAEILEKVEYDTRKLLSAGKIDTDDYDANIQATKKLLRSQDSPREYAIDLAYTLWMNDEQEVRAIRRAYILDLKEDDVKIPSSLNQAYSRAIQFAKKRDLIVNEITNQTMDDALFKSVRGYISQSEGGVFLDHLEDEKIKEIYEIGLREVLSLEQAGRIIREKMTPSEFIESMTLFGNLEYFSTRTEELRFDQEDRVAIEMDSFLVKAKHRVYGNLLTQADINTFYQNQETQKKWLN